MFIKVSKIAENVYQIENNDIPIDIDSLKGLLKEASIIDSLDLDKWLDTLDKKGENKFEVKSNKGTVVNIYEVEYPIPRNPNEETQMMAKNLDEYKDFITQNLFPGVESEEIVITTKNEIKRQKRIPDMTRSLSGVRNVKKGWREVLVTSRKMV